MRELTLATRESALSLAQAMQIKALLGAEGVFVKILKCSTRGDRDKVTPLRSIGGNGLFVREIERQVLEKNADFAVHCVKDLPYETAQGLVIAGTPEAADSRDCLLSLRGTMPEEASDLYRLGTIGTGSARRIYELKRLCPKAEFVDIRGNITTRMEKLRRGQCGAIVLAKAGLDRLGADLSDFDVRILRTDEVIPACGQGILALQCREDDAQTRQILEKISDSTTNLRFQAERYLFRKLKADCRMAVGVYSEIDADGKDMTLYGMFEGRKYSARGPVCDYRRLARTVSERIYDEVRK